MTAQIRNHRPRVLSWQHAGAMLFGDWGTSRLYVLGLALYYCGQSAIYYMAAMSVLLLALAWAYDIVCSRFPDGGGAYSAGAEIGRPVAVLGGLLLSADYVVTAGLSAVAAFHYFGAEQPGAWAAVSIVALGILNYFGPVKAGTFALVTGIVVLCLTTTIGLAAVPFLGQASIVPPEGSPVDWWVRFTGIVLAISGVESIANMTGIMRIPVERTARRAIWPVAFEIVAFNLLLTLAMQAVPLAVLGDGDPTHAFTAHRDNMLGTIASYFVGPTFASIASVGFAVLLLSAVNTAISDLVSIQYRMANDVELPSAFLRLNRWGMPSAAVIVAVVLMVATVLASPNVLGLSRLYSLSVCSVIALNLACCAASRRLEVRLPEKAALIALAVLLFAMAVTIAIHSPQALLFVSIIVVAGFGARWFARNREQVKGWLLTDADFPLRVPLPPTESMVSIPRPERKPTPSRRVLVATEGDNELLRFAAEQAQAGDAELVVAFIRHVAVDAPATDSTQTTFDRDALRVQAAAEQIAAALAVPSRFIFTTGADVGQTVLDIAVKEGCDTLILGCSHRSQLWKAMKGDVIQTVADHLPRSIRLIVQS